MTALTTSESARLTECEKIIDKTKNSFLACGRALEVIRDKKLYREHYSSFEEYCSKKWKWTRRRANQLISAATIVEEINREAKSDNHVSSISITERGVRELSKVPKGSRIDVVRRASKSGRVTSDKIKEVAKAVEREESSAIDETGYLVPKQCLEYWHRKDEAREILRAISHAKAMVRQISPDDGMYAETHVNGVLARLNQAYNEFLPSVPYAVCPVCQGVAAKTCTLCKGRGLISKFRWETCVPEELKEMRKKASEAA